jgi:hypothetical protein
VTAKQFRNFLKVPLEIPILKARPFESPSTVEELVPTQELAGHDGMSNYVHIIGSGHLALYEGVGECVSVFPAGLRILQLPH